jgi:hypothetical protein
MTQTKIVKRLELKRETVRALVMKTGLRTGAAEPELHGTQGSICCVPETSAASGGGGNGLPTGDSLGGKFKGGGVSPSVMTPSAVQSPDV